MSRISLDNEVLDELLQALANRSLPALNSVAAPASQTSASITLAYTTDDPGITADGSITIADGDAVTAAEQIESMDEIITQVNALVADMTAIRTALNSLVTSGGSAASAPAALTSVDAISFTYTTDDPALTADAAVTIADGDATLVPAEAHEAYFELATELNLVADDVQALHEAVTIAIRDGLQFAPVLAARSSTNGGVTFTYTTDDPSVTPNNSLTIADGDLAAIAEQTEAWAEINDDLDKLGDDYTAMKTSYDLLLTAVGRPTS